MTKCILLVFISGALVLGASPVEARTYRRIRRGVGNCIFSASPLPKHKESTYRGVKTVFAAASTKAIYARCYHKKESSFVRLGRVYNSLRNHGKIWLHFKWMGINSEKWRKYAYRPVKNNDQGYYYLGKISNCDYCADLRKTGRALGGDHKKRMRFCVAKVVPYANRHKRQWIWDGGVRKQVTDNINKTISRGCFTLKFK